MNEESLQSLQHVILNLFQDLAITEMLNPSIDGQQDVFERTECHPERSRRMLQKEEFRLTNAD